MISFDQNQTRAGLPFDQLIPALKEMFIEGCIVPVRHSHALDPATEDSGVILLMPAWQVEGYIGIKTVMVHPGNRNHGLPGLHSTFTLFDSTTGVPLAHLDGNEITSRRTAAASALAATWLSREDAHNLLVVGAGRVASLIPQAYRNVRDIQKVKVWDIDRSMAEKLVERLRSDGFIADYAKDLESAVKWADIISCATLSTKPLIKGEWLPHGVHVDLIGAFTPTMRESDDICVQRASVFVDTDEAAAKAGDLLEPIKSGVFRKEDIRATLSDLCKAIHRGRESHDEITLFKAVGNALEDLAAASLVFNGLSATKVDAPPQG